MMYMFAKKTGIGFRTVVFALGVVAGITGFSAAYAIAPRRVNAQHFAPTHLKGPEMSARVRRVPIGGMVAPDFSLKDLNGKTFHLRTSTGEGQSVWFFCGCEWCHACAKEWGAFQRAGIVPDSATVIVFAGDRAAAQSFLNSSGLDPRSTRILPDPDVHVTFDEYRVNPCPRVFVIGPSKKIVWTNGSNSVAPQKAPAAAIVAGALSALRSVLESHHGK